MSTVRTAILAAVAVSVVAATRTARAADVSSAAPCVPSATEPSRFHVDAEIDPTAYALRGYSLHLGLGWKRIRLDLGGYAMAVPQFAHGDDGFDVSFDGYGAKLQLFPFAEQSGPFVGVDGGVTRVLAQRQGTDLASRDTQLGIGTHLGWRIPIVAGLYATPWIGVSWSPDAHDVTLAGATYKANPVAVFPAVHVGWRFQ